MGNIINMLNIIDFISNPFIPLKTKIIYLGIPTIFILIAILIFVLRSKKEKFIGTDMWFGYAFQDANKTSKEERTKSLQKIAKGWLPGERPKEDGLLENFENIQNYYNPRTYEVEPDYHRTVQQFGVDPNPIESLETPEFMIPKTYRGTDKFEKLTEADHNYINSIKLKAVESTFKNVEKNKYYADLLKSKCRAGNRSSYKNCGCKAPMFGEY